MITRFVNSPCSKCKGIGVLKVFDGADLLYNPSISVRTLDIVKVKVITCPDCHGCGKDKVEV